jgi:predicted Zn-dependent protease
MAQLVAIRPWHPIVLTLLLAAAPGVTGCGAPDFGEGPGGRVQHLALTPEQEYILGQKAYDEVLSKSQPLPRDRPEVRFVTEVGQRIVGALQNDLQLREIHLVRVKDYRWDWEFNVLQDKQINAFCLPGGRVAVYTGLLNVVDQNGDFLATVLGHEISHALAHHASERIAREPMWGQALAAVNGVLGDTPDSRRLIGLLAAGSQVGSLRYDRQQESEADHIGIFLMTFAGYDPAQAVQFWERMQQETGGHGPPEMLSDHPSDAHRIAAIRGWAERAKAAKQAFDAGRVVH